MIETEVVEARAFQGPEETESEITWFKGGGGQLTKVLGNLALLLSSKAGWSA